MPRWRLNPTRWDTSRLELVLVAVVAFEAVLGRLITRGLERKPVLINGVSERIVPPAWFVALDYVAIFLLYFGAVLGVLVVSLRAMERGRAVLAPSTGAPVRDTLARLDALVGWFSTVVLACAAIYAAAAEPGPAQATLHAALGVVAAHQVIRVWIRRDDLGTAIGLTLCAAPVIMYCFASSFSAQLWTEDQMLGGKAQAGLDRWGRTSLVLGAIGSPYALAPRPISRSMTRVLPFAVAMTVAALGALALRIDYVSTIKAVNRTLGLDLHADAPQDQIALYLLAFATVTWTVIACVTAPSPARRQIGLGLALLVLAGYGFRWPITFVAAALGLIMIGEAAARVRAEEHATMAPVTPTIDDDVWQGFVGQLVAALRRDAPDVTSAVSIRGEGDHTSTVVLTRRRGVAIRIRVERVAGSVVVFDVVCGREVDASRLPTWTAVARSPGVLGAGAHPEPPPGGAVVKTDDTPFDERFRCRGDRAVLSRMLDDDLRALAAASLDGWLACWDGQSLRHRVFPGQGAPLDQPLPLSELAFHRRAAPASVERTVAVVELCARVAARGLPDEDEPDALAGEPDEAADDASGDAVADEPASPEDVAS